MVVIQSNTSTTTAFLNNYNKTVYVSRIYFLYTLYENSNGGGKMVDNLTSRLVIRSVRKGFTATKPIQNVGMFGVTSVG